MKRKTVIFYVLAFVVGFFMGFFIDNVILTGKVSSEIPEVFVNKTYTTAICNAENECIDIFVECSGSRVVKLEPVSKLIEFDSDWSDFRENVEDYC